jgi:hypothetical protein
VVTFGILNMPDANSARRVIDGMRGGTLGSFVPKHHGASAEGTAGKGQSTWWFITRPDGHFVTFATGAYASGDRVVNRDPTMVACDNDMLKVVHERLASRR